MRTATITVALVAGTALAGCVSTETVRFQPKAEQQAMVRDGRAVIASNKGGSTVLVSPASREFGSGDRPVYVVAIQNKSARPMDFTVGSVAVYQKKTGQTVALRVRSYEELVSEERARQVGRALLVGIAAAGNSMQASQVRNPGVRYFATAHANAENAELAANVAARGQLNMAHLEQTVIKDNTIMPGEWYGGQLHFEPPVSDGSGQPKTYTIRIPVGTDMHEIEVTQVPRG